MGRGGRREGEGRERGGLVELDSGVREESGLGRGECLGELSWIV